MKTFWSVFFAILAAAAVIGGVLFFRERSAAAKQAAVAASAKIDQARAAGNRCLSAVEAIDLQLIDRSAQTVDVVSVFAELLRTGRRIAPDLPSEDRAHFMSRLNSARHSVVETLAARRDLLELLPPPLE